MYSRYITLSGVVRENIYLLEGVVLQVSRGSDEGKGIFSTSGFVADFNPFMTYRRDASYVVFLKTTNE